MTICSNHNHCSPLLGPHDDVGSASSRVSPAFALILITGVLLCELPRLGLNLPAKVELFSHKGFCRGFPSCMLVSLERDVSVD